MGKHCGGQLSPQGKSNCKAKTTIQHWKGLEFVCELPLKYCKKSQDWNANTLPTIRPSEYKPVDIAIDLLKVACSVLSDDNASHSLSSTCKQV